MILQEIGKFHVEVSVIPNGLEKYMVFTINKNLVFIDSMQFKNSSLYALVKNFSDNDFKYLSQEFSGDLFKLVKQKEVDPYEYMDSFEKLYEDKLPDKCKFFSSFKNECITEKDYLHAIDVWNVFKMNTMGDYHDLYLKTDVLLLADVFEKFINTCLDYYGLDPCHYFSSPGLSWDALLKMTGIELELISDIDMLLFIEKGMREGISYIAKRYSKGNKYIVYLDANNLYGCTMSQYLPYREFKWLNQKEIDGFDVNVTECNLIIDGYILEVDLEYLDELHELHNDYALAPEKLEMSHNMLSNYCSNIANDNGINVGGVNKLVPNLGNKSKYVLHYKNLQLYLSSGVKLTKLHRILKFKQSDWLKKYTDFNLDKRKHATNSFKKDFFKLLNKSVFRKAMENLRKIINVRLVNNKVIFPH